MGLVKCIGGAGRVLKYFSRNGWDWLKFLDEEVGLVRGYAGRGGLVKVSE